ncbi:MAG TPA: N-acetylmuramoyl-L-alanine amidase, partial [Halothiobacillaceae bacterium]|nr:N-acetylmuramoyl-L-alanine amidase [Halothiobacillaceae bacterium]
VNEVSVYRHSDYTRYVFALNGPVDYRSLILDDPHRAVVDLSSTTMQARDIPSAPEDSVVRNLRFGVRDGYDLRLVFDLKQKSQPRILTLPPSEEYGYRLVVDLPHDDIGLLLAEKNPEPKYNVGINTRGRDRDLVVVIDPGHGGRDPGAVGSGGTREKDVVLEISRRIEALFEKKQGIKPVLVRDSDRFIRLRDRITFARRHKADLFISMHSDAFRLQSARGASVYCLSEGGATSEAARWMAQRENEADFVGGVSIAKHDHDVASVLLDLAQTKTLEYSLDFGNRVLREMGRMTRLHKSSVQQAGFVVLKSPDIPSILVESAFISNPEEERLLRTASYQQKVAQAVVRGTDDYFTARAPSGTYYAMS